MISFESLGISEPILKAIGELGFSNPMPIQEKVIPLLLSDRRDVLALAQTGTGKTAAFGIPILELVDPDNRNIQSIVLAPTRELCLQITSDLNNYAKYLPEVKILAVYGGSSIENQIRELKRGVQIVVATPGRLIDLMERKAARLQTVSTMVLDEADEMLNMGFQESIDKILETVPGGRQTLLFSATMPPEIARIAGEYMTDPIEVTVGTKNAGAENVHHIYYLVHAKEKYLALKRIADFEPDIYGIVFCRTRKDAQEVASKLIHDGYNADALHGDLSQAQRDSVMQRFRIRNIQLLVATDVAARGLDVDDLTHIIHYSLPESASVYNHRSGRTARAGKTGVSVSLVHLKEKQLLQEIERKIKKKIELTRVPTGKEICTKQLFHWVHKLEETNESNAQIEALLPEIYDRLATLDRNSLIRKMVTMEFNRFLDYYHDTEDLENINTDKNQKRKEFEGQGRRSGAEKFTRLFINQGKIDGLFPEQLIQLINQNIKGKKIQLGKIDLSRNYSFFEVEPDQADKIIHSLTGLLFRDREVIVQRASGDENSRERTSRKKREFGDNKKREFGNSKKREFGNKKRGRK